jgi:hypothetical protein
MRARNAQQHPRNAAIAPRLSSLISSPDTRPQVAASVRDVLFPVCSTVERALTSRGRTLNFLGKRRPLDEMSRIVHMPVPNFLSGCVRNHSFHGMVPGNFGRTAFGCCPRLPGNSKADLPVENPFASRKAGQAP